MTPDTVPRFSDSSVGSHDARRGASSFDRRDLLRTGAPARSQQRCRAPLASSGAGSRAIHCPPIPTGAIPGSRDSHRGFQNAQRAVSKACRRGHLGGPTPTGSRQGYPALLTGGYVQSEVTSPRPLPPGAAPPGTRVRRLKMHVKQSGASSEGIPWREPRLRVVSGVAGQRSVVAELVVESGLDLPPPLPPGATAGSRDSRTPPPNPPPERNMRGATSGKQRSPGS